MNDNCCRWGFLSTAGIGKKNWQAIQLAGNAKLVAVASRNLEQASQFIQDCQTRVPFDELPQAVVGYENLIARDDIDAVYIPLPTGLRKDWVIRAAEAGKNVLCEKPCAINADHLREMLNACDRNNVQFMDGVMFMHTDRLEQLGSALNTEIGSLRRIHSQLTFHGGSEFQQENIRTCSQLEPHGCLGDLGWYNIRIALWAMNWKLPTHVIGRTLSDLKRPDSNEPVPISFSGELFFEDGVSAGFYCSFEANHQQYVTISGTDGFVRVADFVLPYAKRPLQFEQSNATFELDECRFEMFENETVIETDEAPNNAPNSQETKLFRKFSDLVNSGARDKFWPQIAYSNQLVMDALFESARNEGRQIEVPKLQL